MVETPGKKFINQIADLNEGFEAVKIPLSMYIVAFLENWLFSHILGTDQKYSEFFNTNGIA